MEFWGSMKMSAQIFCSNFSSSEDGISNPSSRAAWAAARAYAERSCGLSASASCFNALRSDLLDADMRGMLLTGKT